MLVLDPKSVVIGPPEQQQSGSAKMKLCYRLNGVNIPFMIQFPRMYCPFPLGIPMDDQKKNQRTVTVNFRDEENRRELQKFREMWDAVRVHLVEVITHNYVLWFGGRKKISKNYDQVDEMLFGLIRDGYSKKQDKVFPDSMLLKIGVRGTRTNSPSMTAAFFDENNQLLQSEEELHLAGADIVTTAQLSEIWCVSKSLYPRFELGQCKIYPAQRANTTFGIVEQDADGMDKNNNNGADMDAPPAKQHIIETQTDGDNNNNNGSWRN